MLFNYLLQIIQKLGKVAEIIGQNKKLVKFVLCSDCILSISGASRYSKHGTSENDIAFQKCKALPSWGAGPRVILEISDQ